MRIGISFAVLFALTACSAPRPRPEFAAPMV
jgi:hypothetical protein